MVYGIQNICGLLLLKGDHKKVQKLKKIFWTKWEVLLRQVMKRKVNFKNNNSRPCQCKKKSSLFWYKDKRGRKFAEI